MKSGHGTFKPLIPLGVELMARARLTWIEEVRKLLEDTNQASKRRGDGSKSTLE